MPRGPELGAPTLVLGIDESEPLLVESVESVSVAVWGGDATDVAVGSSLMGVVHNGSSTKHVTYILAYVSRHIPELERGV